MVQTQAAEQPRLAMLSVSGRLDPALYGRPILPHRTAENPLRRLTFGPVDGNGRRSVYLQMSIMSPPAFLMVFDLPDLKLPSGKRNVTNVPTQSLVMLNDSRVSTLAKHWTAQLVKTPAVSPEERVNQMFIRTFAREPQPTELQNWTAALHDFATTADVMQDEPAWTQLAHAFFNTAEFTHYR